MKEIENTRNIIEIQSFLDTSRWKGVRRDYTAQDVYRLRGSLEGQYPVAQAGAGKLWQMLHNEPLVKTFGALTGQMAVRMVQAGLKAIYCSGWQVASDANLDGHTYPDQSLYPVNSMPFLIKRINNAFLRRDQVQKVTGKGDIDWLAPIVADAESGFGGNLNAFELMRAMIEAGVAAVHFEDQLASEKKCGDMGGKVVIPASEFLKKIKAARLAADVMGVPTILIARTDAFGAKLLANYIDSHDEPFVAGPKNSAGLYRYKGGVEAAIARALVYAPYSDVVLYETSEPSLEEAKKFAETVHYHFPGRLLAYNFSPASNWKNLSKDILPVFQEELGKLGYRLQYVSLGGFHILNFYTFMTAREYVEKGLLAFTELRQSEFRAEFLGYSGHHNQEEVGTEYFDQIQLTIAGEDIETIAVKSPTEKE